MAKKRDILSNYFNDFEQFKRATKARLDDLKRDFNSEKTEYDRLLAEINNEFSIMENIHADSFSSMKDDYQNKINLIVDDYRERFSIVEDELDSNNHEEARLIEEENRVYQEILSQFEERKQEALNRYLQLIHDSDKFIDETVDFHQKFVEEENSNLHNLKESYSDINSFLANDLLNSMEKAKNSLNVLSESLNETNLNDSKELNQTVLKSLEDLRGAQFNIISIFKDSTITLEEKREEIRKISRTKQKPHSEMNQSMIQKYVQQIRELNQNKVSFEAKLKSDLDMSLLRIHQRIFQADKEKDYKNLEKYILQKAIIEKKADYLLKRSQTLTKFSISKYQQEIKKIKIDSFKRSEEIKLAYSLPIAFLQNSIDSYSNFAFYLNQGFDELDRLLNSLISFHQDFLDIKTQFITETSKAYEDYKINLIVRINEVTCNLTKLISRIDDVSLEIVTLESKNRLEIAEIKKKIENLEIFGDYQKYLASLENDEFFAMYQHNKNIEKIQIAAKYKENLLQVNWDVLKLNQNKELERELLEYQVKVSNEEKAAHQLNFRRLEDEYEAFYSQQNKLTYLLYKMAKIKITEMMKQKNHAYVSRFYDIKNQEDKKDKIGSDAVVDFVHYIQGLIDANNTSTTAFKQYLDQSKNPMSYLTIVEKNRLQLKLQVKRQFEEKTSPSYQSIINNYHYTGNTIREIRHLINDYIHNFKLMLLFFDKNQVSANNKILKDMGYNLEVSSLLKYINDKALNIAFSYQIPEKINSLAIRYEKYFIEYNTYAVDIISKVEKKINKKISIQKIKEYLIRTLELLVSYRDEVIQDIEYIRDKVSEKDVAFIAKAKINALENQKIIDEENDKFAFSAIKMRDNKKQEISSLIDRSTELNEIFKNRVKKINDIYLKEKNQTEEFLSKIEKEIIDTVNDNDKQLVKMLKMIDKELYEERIKFNKEYQDYLNTINVIKANITATHEEEIKYLHELNSKRNADIDKTIQLLETKVNALPEEKTKLLQEIDYQKSELFQTKQNELLRRYSDIEGRKMLSKPELMAEIEKVEKRLPEDYVKLYNQISELENEYLQQYTLINEDYLETYQDYVNKQSINRLVLEDDGQVLNSFDLLNKYHQDLLNVYQISHREIMQKSNDTREQIKEEKQKSKAKQDRIINA